MTTTQVYYLGLSKLRRDLKRADPELEAELKAGLKAMAGNVAQEAQRRARAVATTHPTGDMEAKIKPSVTGFSARIREFARHGGFNYPVRFEFGDYDKPFMEPALEAKRRYVEGETDRLLARALNRVRLG